MTAEEQMLAIASQLKHVRQMSLQDILFTVMLRTSHIHLSFVGTDAEPACLSGLAQCTDSAPVLQTPNHLHLDSKVCHLDITPGNIMLQSTPASPWDAVCLIDFGFAAEFDPGAVADTTGKFEHAFASNRGQHHSAHANRHGRIT